MSVHWKPVNRDNLESIGVNLSNWPIFGEGERGEIIGKLPELQEKLGKGKSNRTLATEWGVTPRQASKIRNRRRPLPSKP